MRFDPAALVAALASGLLLGLCVPPAPLGMAAGVALVPLLGVWDRAASGRDLLLPAYLAFLTTAAVAFRWPLGHVLPGAAAASFGAWLFLPFLHAAPFALSVGVRRRLGRAAGLAYLIALTLVAEGLMARGPWAFPWTLLGHTLAETRLPAQAADLFGVPGLSLVLLLLNAGAFLTGRLRGSARLAAAGAAFALLAALYGYGAWRLQHLPVASTASIDVAFLQPAIDAPRWADVHDARRVDTLLALTAPALATTSPPDLVVWPETALPILRPGDALDRRLRAWTRAHGTALLTGAIVDTAGAFYNSARLYRPDAPPRRYDKRRLVPFAEAVPFADRLPLLDAFGVDAGGVAAYRPGGAAPPLAIGGGRFGIMICLESVFGLDARAAARAGAGAFIVLTQDGWWGPSAGFRQHIALTRLRAIETRRAVLQVAVTGASALVLPDGTFHAAAGWMERALHRVAVPLGTTSTVFLRLGDVITPVAALVVLGLVVLRYATRRRPFR